MKQNFQKIIRYLIGTDHNGLAGINISDQFDPGDMTEESVLRNLNSAFLIALAGDSHPFYEEAKQYLKIFRSHEKLDDIPVFFDDGPELIISEIEKLCSSDKDFEQKLRRLYEFLEDDDTVKSRTETVERIRTVFFPEGLDICSKREEKISELREKRKIRISRLNPDPISEPGREVLFTSNILITVPPRSEKISDLPLSPSLRQRIEEVMNEQQLFWYDHPVQIGVETDKNEAMYGLKGLDRAVRFEKKRGTLPKDYMIQCVLSVSATHKGLQTLIKDYLEEEFEKDKSLENLTIHLFSEGDTTRLIEEVLIPAADRYLQRADTDLLYEIIGVDGEYGRHYSFLKAISAFWHVLIDPDIRATFKIDLDQVFPQETLVEQTGESAFQHLTTSLWGAEGTDAGGEAIELGMIAGALVNECDIDTSLFCPDVCFPPEEIRGDELVFYSPLPQALSTEAEMMTRYNASTCNGNDHCIQRIHVTGGTCGILVDSLRKHRPFTPSFIGRAEDQAYLLSVLFTDSGRNLRYVHKDGLVMRHDKEAFAREAIKSAYLGKLVGDYARILWYSYYVDALPWPFKKTKGLIDPFTGCFASPFPFTITYLRLSLKVASLFASGDEETRRKASDLLRLGASRLHRIILELNREPNPLIERSTREKEGWDMYYDIIDRIEKGLKENERFALELREKAQGIIGDCRMNC